MPEARWADRPEPPVDGDDAATMLGSLERMRYTFWWKCSGVGPAGLALRIGSSAMTLGGLLQHLALVEEHTFSVKLWGRPMSEPWVSVDWEADPDFEWRTAADRRPAQLMEAWVAAVQRARSDVRAALEEGGLGFQARFSWPDGRSPTLRRLLADQIEEYGRHTGHADMLREAVDGRVGEDPPWPPDAPIRLWGPSR